MKKIIISLAIITMLTACGGIGSSDDVSSQNNGFSVTSISPSANSKIEQNQEFIITFNNNLDPDSIGNVRLLNKTMNIDEPISCTLLDSVSISCIPQRSLELNSKYELILSSSIKNKSENPLNTDTIEYNGKTQPIVSSATPESGNLEPNVTKFTYNFSESMDIDTLDSTKNIGNVTLTNTTESTGIGIKCDGVNTTTMECTSDSAMTEGDSYLITLSSKIKSKDGVSLESSNYTYVVKEATYNWNLIYTLPSNILGSISYNNYNNGALYICSAVNESDPDTPTFLAQFNGSNWTTKTLSTGMGGPRCLAVANGDVYGATGWMPNNQVYRYSFNGNQFTHLYDVGMDNELILFNAEVSTIVINNVLYTYLVSSHGITGPSYLGMYDGSYKSTNIPSQGWSNFHYINNTLYMIGNQNIYKYNDGRLIDITPKFDIPDEIRQKYGEYDSWYGNAQNSNSLFLKSHDGYVYQYDGTNWNKTSMYIPFDPKGNFFNNIIATNRYIIYITREDHLLKRYDLLNHNTDDITPSGLISEQLQKVSRDGNGNLYISTNKSVYKGSIE